MRRLVIVTGLSGAGKSQALKIVRRFGLATLRLVGELQLAS
jgi:RNase adaptor protein for sRNA GlmZ degradation